jgi:hypothetical protein
MKKVEDLEAHLADAEAEITEMQAREAIVEAEFKAVKVLLDKTRSALEDEQIMVKTVQEAKLTMEVEKKSLIVELEEAKSALNSSKSAAEDASNQKKLELTQALIHTKDIQLRHAKEILEDWAMISRLMIEHLSENFKAWSEFVDLVPPSFTFTTINFDEVLRIDFEEFPSEMEAFLSAMNSLVKDIYDITLDVSHFQVKETSIAVKESFMQLKSKYQNRISFSHFWIGSVVLFLPTKNGTVWTAFNVAEPYYFLNTNSHPVFEKRVKKKEWILAVISLINPHIAGQNDTYKVTPGIQYFICDAYPWEPAADC